MGMSVWVLIIFISDPEPRYTSVFYEDILGPRKRSRGRTFAFPGAGCTARARRWCLSSIVQDGGATKPDSGVVIIRLRQPWFDC